MSTGGGLLLFLSDVAMEGDDAPSMGGVRTGDDRTPGLSLGCLEAGRSDKLVKSGLGEHDEGVHEDGQVGDDAVETAAVVET